MSEGGSTVNVGGIQYVASIDLTDFIADRRRLEQGLDEAAGAGKGLQTSLTAAAQAARQLVTGLNPFAIKQTADALRDSAAANAKAAAGAKDGAAAFAKQGASAKQMAAAMRGVPAQFTDIATSIAAGQNPLTVLLQQGGQLKDMFGGIVPAAKALGSYIAGLFNPFTLAAAAAGTFLTGLVMGEQEMQDFNRALVLSGNAAGVTSDDLNALAKRMDDLAGVTRGQAAAALTTFAALGISGADNLGKFTEASIRLEQAGGPAVEETAKHFQELERSPVQAAMRLNQSINFLTESTYKEIRALEQQGKLVEAARVAQNAYADAINARAGQVVENIGLIEKAWRGVKNGAREGWDALLGIGRSQTPEEALQGTRAEIAGLQAQLASGGSFSAANGVRGEFNSQEKAAMQARLTSLQEQVKLAERMTLASQETARADADRQNRVEAMASFDQEGLRFLTERQRMELEITRARELGNAAGLTAVQIEERIAAIRKSYKVDSKRLEAQAYYEGLVADSKSAMDKINAEEQKALTDNAKRRQNDLANADVYDKARVAITAKYSRERALLEDKDAHEIAELRIAVTLDEVEKIRAIRDEAIRSSQADELLGVKTAEQAARARVLANFNAAQALAGVADRDARALAESQIAITKSQEANIALVRDEAIRQAQEGYERGEKSFIEAEAAKLRALQAFNDQMKALQASREQYQIGTLQMNANNGGGPPAQEELISAQAAAAQAANDEAASHDLENAQIYSDRRVAIEADMQEKLRQLRMTQLGQAGDVFGAMGNMMEAFAQAGIGSQKKMFAAAKAFALADAIVKGAMAIMNAQASAPWPYNIPAMVIAGATTAAQIATISSANYGGGRQYGGTASPDTMYRVNETGRPEVFTASTGQQYMLPTKGGHVTAADKVGQAGGDGAPVVKFGDVHLELQGVPMPNGMWAIDPGQLADAIKRAYRDGFITDRQ